MTLKIQLILLAVLVGTAVSDSEDLSTLNQQYTFIDDDVSQRQYHLRLKRQVTPPSAATTTQQPTTTPPITQQPTTASPITQQPTTTPVTAKDGSTIAVDWAQTDNHKFYNVSYLSSPSWFTLDETSDTVIRHASLQNSHRLAVKIKLDFTFLFYGHDVTSVTIATGGFLYMSEFLHTFLTASQYIAPLMANFDPSLSNTSEILYQSTADHFIVEWRNVSLQDQPELGQFTFQAQLFKELGTIILAYKTIPVVDISLIQEKHHPVKVGLSDAYYWDVGYYRTIYPYHAIQIPKNRIQQTTALRVNHLKSCNMLDSCSVCLNYSKVNPQFKCHWCSELDKCSDGFDRRRQDWVSRGCPVNTTQSDCSLMFTTLPTTSKQLNQESTTNQSRSNSLTQDWPSQRMTEKSKIPEAIGAGFAVFIGLMALIFIIVLVYGYRNPEGEIGQFFIRNRPAELARRFKDWRRKDSSDQNNMHPIS